MVGSAKQIFINIQEIISNNKDNNLKQYKKTANRVLMKMPSMLQYNADIFTMPLTLSNELNNS